MGLPRTSRLLGALVMYLLLTSAFGVHGAAGGSGPRWQRRTAAKAINVMAKRPAGPQTYSAPGHGHGIPSSAKNSLTGVQVYERCDAKSCLSITQHAARNPNSMFDVQVVNTCLTCTICHAHAYCPNFFSTISVDPNVFIRVSGSVCRINGGHAIYPSQMLLFQYGASFQSVIRPRSCERCKW